MNNSCWEWSEHGCPLGYDCSQMDLRENGECWNEQDCFAWIESWDLYDILLIPGLPGALYVAYWGQKMSPTDNQWVKSPIFKKIEPTDWLIYLAASSCLSFEEWQSAYQKLRWSKENYRSVYVLASLWGEFDRLHDEVLGEPETDPEESDLIPF